MSHSDRVVFNVGKLNISSGSVDIGNTSTATVETLPAAVALGNAPTATLTATQMFSRFGTTNPGAAATFTSPTAVDLVAGAPSTAQVGDCYELTVINTNGTNTATVAGGTGVTVVGAGAVATNSSGSFVIRFTNVTSGAEAVVVYRV